MLSPEPAQIHVGSMRAQRLCQQPASLCAFPHFVVIVTRAQTTGKHVPSSNSTICTFFHSNDTLPTETVYVTLNLQEELKQTISIHFMIIDIRRWFLVITV